MVLGYLLDGFGSPRDYVGDNVVISHGGGRSGKSNTGEYHLIDDQQRSDLTVSALFRNKELGIPCILIVGSNCAAARFQIPRRYCVLDWFRVTHLWVCKLPRQS